LRATIYELARHKLREQFASEKLADMRKLSKALEIAIQGVETFVAKNDQAMVTRARPELGQPRLRALPASARPEAASLAAPPVIEVVPQRSLSPSTQRTRSRFRAPWRFIVVIAAGLAVVFAVKQRVVGIDTLRKGVDQLASLRTSVAAKPTQLTPPQEKTQITDHQPVEPPPLTPTAYGIYAVSEDKLYELELLPGRAPDIRVAVSPATLTPSKTTLPDGHLKFIVYRRDSATNAVDRAEIRVVAKVAQEMSFDKSGKPAMSKIDDTWVIRNIAIPFRTAPKNDNPDMYEVRSENPEAALTPGRYALVLKGQAYDFSVAGEVIDPRQCLERLAATNGQFYSECQKP
jgi:hypothetical protein